MFMSPGQDYAELDTLFTKSKNMPKKAVKAKDKAPKSKGKVKVPAKKSVKPVKSSIKKVKKPIKPKQKAYKVSGSFSLDKSLEIVKKTKSIHSVGVYKYSGGKNPKPEILSVVLLVKRK